MTAKQRFLLLVLLFVLIVGEFTVDYISLNSLPASHLVVCSDIVNNSSLKESCIASPGGMGILIVLFFAVTIGVAALAMRWLWALEAESNEV